jgi:hypothetical protein
VHLLVDSTGLKLSGAGEWLVEKHGTSRRRSWRKLHIGVDADTGRIVAAALTTNDVDVQREIIDFDSASPAGLQFLAFTTATGLSRYIDVPWPAGLAAKTGPKPRGSGDSPLPRADVLVVTWTVDEGHALSRVLTPGKDSHIDYVSYTHNFTARCTTAFLEAGSSKIGSRATPAYHATAP